MRAVTNNERSLVLKIDFLPTGNSQLAIKKMIDIYIFHWNFKSTKANIYSPQTLSLKIIMNSNITKLTIITQTSQPIKWIIF